LKQGTAGVSTTKYGQQLMKEMMMTYDGNQAYYAKLASHGYTMLAQAMEKDLPYILECPTILLCGTKDRAGSCIRYNKAWHKDTGIDLYWIEGAGHNSNTDRIEEVNSLIETFIREIK
jgi:pimeloyl-ACP methyl ester carboxylesterase